MPDPAATPAPAGEPGVLTLPWELLHPLLHGDPAHPELQRSLAALLTTGPTPPPDRFAATAELICRDAPTLVDDLRAALAGHPDPLVRIAAWSRPDVDADALAAHLASEGAVRTRVRLLEAHPDLPAEVRRSAVSGSTRDGARYVLTHPDGFDTATRLVAVRKLAPGHANLSADVLGALHAAARTDGVAAPVAADPDLPAPVRRAALTHPSVPQALVRALLADPAVFPVPDTSVEWRRDVAGTYAALAGRRDLTPGLARTLTDGVPDRGWIPGHAKASAVAAWATDVDVDVADTLTATTTTADLGAAWAAVPDTQRPAAAWVAARHPACDPELADTLDPWLTGTPGPVRETYLTLWDRDAAAGSWLQHRTTWLARYLRVLGAAAVRDLLDSSRDPAWRQVCSALVVDAAQDGTLASNTLLAAAAADGFDPDCFTRLPFPIIAQVLTRPLDSTAQAHQVLAVLTAHLGTGPHRAAAIAAVARHGAPFAQVCAAASLD